MKLSLVILVLLAGFAPGQMEMRRRVLYDLAAFRQLSPAVGKMLPELVLRDLGGKKVKLSELRRKPLIIIGGAYT